MKVLVCQTQDLVPMAALAAPLMTLGVEPVTWRTDREVEPPALDGFGAVIALGGAANPDEDERYPWLETQRDVLREALRMRLPTLGLCLGAQLLAQVAGGSVVRLPEPEIGWRALPGDAPATLDPVYSTLPPRPHVFEWHAYGFTLPPGAALLAGSVDAVQAFRHGDRAWGLQFHLEVDAATVGAWVDHYREELIGANVDPDAITTQTAEHAARNRAQAAMFVRAFAGVARRERGALSESPSGRSLRGASASLGRTATSSERPVTGCDDTV